MLEIRHNDWYVLFVVKMQAVVQHIIIFLILSFAFTIDGVAEPCDGDCEALPGAAVSASDLCQIEKLSLKLAKPVEDTSFLDPELVERTNSRHLAEQLLKRLNTVCDKQRDPAMKMPRPDSSQIVMLVPAEHVASILRNGFKNQHQTSVTGGADAKASRLSAEMYHISMGLPYTNKTRELLPKYAMQVFKDEKQGHYSAPFSYGKVMFRFKEKVKKRSTWSYTDSLALAGASAPLRTNRIGPKAGKTCEIYCEAQIWGELDKSDVESIIMPEGMELTDELKAFGVPIRAYKECSSCVAEGTNLKGVKFGDKIVYAPNNGAVAVPVSKKDRTDATIRSPAEENLFKANRYQSLSTAELVTELAKSKDKQEEKAEPASGIGWGMGGGMGGFFGRNILGSDRLRILAELTTREKDSYLAGQLMNIAKNGANAEERAIALSGLSRLALAQLKPILIKNLSSVDRNLSGQVAFYMGLDYLDDAEIRAALQLFDSPLFNRHLEKKLCLNDGVVK